jgi:hypothetical protein
LSKLVVMLLGLAAGALIPLGSQTAGVPTGGRVFDVKIDRPRIYPFVSHSFASVNLGEVGLLKVGKVAGTMSH